MDWVAEGRKTSLSNWWRNGKKLIKQVNLSTPFNRDKTRSKLEY